MRYYNRNDKITVLPLSVRTTNCLHRAHIFTLGDIENYHNSHDWLALRSMGKISAAEISGWAALLQFDESGICALSDEPRANSEISSDQESKQQQMGDFGRDDDIALLPLSVRTINCLRRACIDTLGDIESYHKSHDWLALQNMGKKSADEISGWAVLLQFDESGKCDLNKALSTGFETSPEDAIKQPVRLDDITIRDLNLSVRSTNALNSAGIEKAIQLIGLDEKDLLAMKGMGRASVQEILTTVDSWMANYLKNPDLLIRDHYQLVVMANDLAAKLQCSVSACLRDILLASRRYPGAQAESLLYAVFEFPFMQKSLKERILSLLTEADDVLTRSDLFNSLPYVLTNTTIIEESLLSLEIDGAITLDENVIQRIYPSVMQCVQQIADDRTRDILLCRLKGNTLDEIGKQYDLTRERVRQIISKCVARWQQKGLRFVEDRYASLFRCYDISIEDFRTAFGEPDTVWNYLEIVGGAGKDRLPLEQALEDSSLGISWKRQLERAVYKQYIMLDGVWVKRTRADLVRHFVQTRCKDSTAMDAFVQMFNDYIQEAAPNAISEQIDDARYIENRFRDGDYTVCGLHRRFRYYDIKGRDFSTLLEAFDITQYSNMEISTRKLFKGHRDVMDEYDIRDEYELHNLLKKILSADFAQVKFGRMPMMAIGTPNRDWQAFELMVELAPISAEDLAQQYEEVYGIRQDTAQGFLCRILSSYFYDGIFTIDTPALSANHSYRMKALLKDDYYSLTTIRKLYLQEFPEADVTYINPYSLKELGFHVYTGYVIRNTYVGASEYFRKLLSEPDIVDARTFDKSIFEIQAYSSELSNLRRSREIIEYGVRQYINIRRLNTVGITAATLQDYCDTIAGYVEKGAIFTITSLRNEGFTHPLDELGFDEWFYGSILLEDRERFSYQRMGNTRVFIKGPPSPSLFIDLLHHLLEDRQKMDIYDLRDLLEVQYGFHMPREKLTEIVRNTDLYYDTIMEAVYLNYDIYFEEV